MRILVLGANGFVGSAIVAALQRAGITVRCVVRAPERLAGRFPGIEVVKADLRDESASDPGHWGEALIGVDAVVNAAGVLQPRRDRDAWAVHCHAPDALFAACEQAGIRRILQISAVGIEGVETVYARSKRAGDEKLMARDLDWTVLRPAIVIGEGSYGGSSMLRAIAAFPWFTPVIGDGANPLDFIHKDDLALSIVEMLRSDAASKTILEPASRERLTLSESVLAYRRWLGLKAAPVFGVPIRWIKALARLGDVVKLDPITTTALAQFQARLTGDPEGFENATGIQARGLSAMLAGRPAEVQDLWHARLYLVRPIIRLSLAALWLVSGLLGLLSDPAQYASILSPLTQHPTASFALAAGMSLIDLAIAAALVAGWRLKEMANVQLVMVIGYTLVLTILAPGLWGDLFGGLLKNLPLIALLLAHRVLEEER